MYKAFVLVLTFLLIFALGLGYFFWRRESHKSAFEKIDDDAIAIKIASEVRDWFKENPSEAASLIVYFDVGQELKSVQYPYEEDQKLHTIAEQIYKKEAAIKRGESVDLAELESEKIAVAELERIIREKQQASLQEMVAYNRALIKPVWDQVVAQLQVIDGVDVYDKDDAYLSAMIFIHAKASCLEAIAAIHQVIKIDLNIPGQASPIIRK